jgi:C4-dicarboxylate transporter DctM subunit
LIAVFVYKSIDMKKVATALFKSSGSAVMILFIIATANAFSFVFMKSQLSTALSNLVYYLSLSPLTFLFLTALIVVIIGTIIDGAAICALLVPALLAIAQGLMINPIHFAMVICVGAVLGSMTPPIAVSIFAAKTFSNLSIGSIVRGQMPFFMGFVLVYGAVVLFPSINQIFLK